MTYEFTRYSSNGNLIFARVDDDGLRRISCNAKNPDFQQWLRKNADNLPADIQTKIEAGELLIKPADTPE